MPNWCSNDVKISFDSGNEEALRDALENDQDLFQQFVPRPEEFNDGEKWYWWNIENWGTKWDTKPYDVEWAEDCVSFRLETAWSPPIKFYEAMQDLGYNIEAWYLEEGMAFCGHFSEYGDNYYQYGNMTADEIENEIPWAEEVFGLVTRQRDWEDEQEDEEDNEYIPASYAESEKTGWFGKKDKPTREGHYEVKTKSWPFPHMMRWNGMQWCESFSDMPSVNKVTEWRGLNSDPAEVDDISQADMIELETKLEELRKEYDKSVID